MLLAPGAFITTMPRALAAGTSTLSTPVPARAIARSRGAALISAAVTLVALRTTIASASAMSAVNCSTLRPERASTFQPSLDSRSMADVGKVVGDENLHDRSVRRERLVWAARGDTGTRVTKDSPSIIAGCRVSWTCTDGSAPAASGPAIHRVVADV